MYFSIVIVYHQVRKFDFMKLVLTILFLLYNYNPMTLNTDFYNFSIEGIDGKNIDFESFKGKKVLIVNVASACGYTPQYAEMQELYEKYSDRLVVIGFPCNDFLSQEKGSNEEIAAFCSSNFGVTFPMTTKIKVKGKEQHPIYAWLTQKSLNGVQDSKVKWNFHKYLINADGSLYKDLPSSVTPLDQEILDWVESN